MMDLDGVGIESSGASGGRISDAGGVLWPSSSSPRSNSERLKTGKGVREFGVVPPFLIKTFSMVNDSNTNSIISWSSSGTSFIVWDHLQFSAELLSQYFKHSNFSSFIYQLNNYGFRKIGVEHQWEYENQYFQAGKEYLLIKIQRRSHKLETLNRQKRTRQPCIALINYETELVLGHLRNSISESKLEFQNLKLKQEDVETQIVTFKQHIENAQNKSKKLLMLLAKALDEIFVYPVMKERDLSNNETRKKPRMAAAQATTNDALQAFNVSSTGDSGTPIQDHKVEFNSEASVKESGEYKFWKELLEGDDAREEMVNIKQQAKIALELENLITKLPEHA
ncbi:Heat stress transcription factor A-7a [Abeliophyllum distichum]|uniref:Heat stress transcription factor A-7a n=1 Tax=Abeliophyllum distichum TaxID=126358 RepID=A0ABD1UFY4_9LAMI